MPLDRQLILSQAFAVLNEGGLESLTLRRLAARLGVQAPAIYWHFKNKQELLDEMGTQVFREALLESPASDDALSSQEWALRYALGLRRTLLRYREGARMFSGTFLTDATLYVVMEASLRRLTGAGFTLRQSVVSLSALYNYTVGFVIEEQAVGNNPRYDLAQRDARVDKERFPLAHAAGREMFTGHEANFREGVGLILAGMAATLAASH
jgi:TetR/AcrR family transcriptional regulator, tetracycline repressor protein